MLDRFSEPLMLGFQHFYNVSFYSGNFQKIMTTYWFLEILVRIVTIINTPIFESYRPVYEIMDRVLSEIL